ncbi:hypothetical protein DQD41_25390 [Salmonella enterica subsp. enterica]|nr:hypothetical protein [Salmonella enterica subsp. enterica serovar Kouka]
MNSQVNILQGIIEKQFIPYIQPVVDAETERLIGGEVLMRWRKSDKEILTPEKISSGSRVHWSYYQNDV